MVAGGRAALFAAACLLCTVSGCTEETGGLGGGEPAEIDLPVELWEDIEVFLSFRTQDNSAPLEISIDGEEGHNYVQLGFTDGRILLTHKVTIPNGRHRAAMDFYLPWSAFENAPSLQPCEGVSSCTYETEEPGCAPGCLHREHAHGEGVRILLMRMTGGVTIAAGGSLDSSKIGFDVPALSTYDEDGDELTNIEEVATYKTNPCRADTDGDNARDKQEIDRDADPLVCEDLPPGILNLEIVTPSDPTGRYANRNDRDNRSTLLVRFSVDKPLDEEAGYPRVNIGEYRTTCPLEGRDDPLGYECSYALDGSESDGTKVVTIVVSDIYGHVANNTDRSVVFDFTPPGVASAGVGYTPGPGNPLGVVSKATTGTTISVTAIADEELATDGDDPTLKASLDSTELDFSQIKRTSSSATFEIVVPEGADDGVYIPALSWTDIAGNHNPAATFASPSIEITTSQPVLTVAQDQVTFLKSPWGNCAEENLGSFRIPSGPYFALAPVDPFSDTDKLPADTFTLDNRELAMIRVLPAAGDGTIMGWSLPNTDGSWPRERLAEVNTPFVAVTGIDPAGNESEPVQITDTVLVATAHLPPSMENPNESTLSLLADEYPQENSIDGKERMPAGGNVGGLDGIVATRSTEKFWRRALFSDKLPSPRNGCALAYDSTRGKVVLFGGSDQTSSFLQDTWEWDGRNWTEVTPAGQSPSPRQEHKMVYDSARGKVVLFGGLESSGTYQDTWEWDGHSWTEMTPAGDNPSARFSHAMAYDSARGKVVLFGGRVNFTEPAGDTWEWNGCQWMEVTPAGDNPVPRNASALAYDSARSKMVLFGGYDSQSSLRDTWEWDGSQWVEVTPASTQDSPWYRFSHAMAYDSRRQRVVIFGGTQFQSNSETWEWNGTIWEERVPANEHPPALSYHQMVYDSARGEMVIFGGTWIDEFLQPQKLQGPWLWDGEDWKDATPTGEEPCARCAHAMAPAGREGGVILFGGYGALIRRSDTWLFDGYRWINVTPEASDPNPAARDGHSMAYDRGRDRVVLFGGQGTSFLQDTWEWDPPTKSWEEITPSGEVPDIRHLHAMAYDSSRGQVLLVGGDWVENNVHHHMQDIWAWDGGNWTDLTPAGTKPASRAFHGIAYASHWDRLVLFGGSDAVFRYDDTWEWNGSGWTDVTPTGSPGTSPSHRQARAMVYNKLLGRTVLFGGFDGISSTDDTWEWDTAGGTWNEITSSANAPTARTSHAMAYDEVAGKTVMFGGYTGQTVGDTWVRITEPGRQPSAQFHVPLEDPGAVMGTIENIHVRAYIGGGLEPFEDRDVGAVLSAWRTHGPGVAPGEWWPLGTTSIGPDPATFPDPANDPSARIEWSSSNADEASQFIVMPERTIYLQVRPVCSSEANQAYRDAKVAVDYLEVRVRYQAQ